MIKSQIYLMHLSRPASLKLAGHSYVRTAGVSCGVVFVLAFHVIAALFGLPAGLVVSLCFCII